MKLRVAFFLSALALGLVQCTRLEIVKSEQAMRPVESWPVLNDDLGWGTLPSSLQKTASVLRESPDKLLQFGPQTIIASDYALALDDLSQTVKDDSSGAKFQQTLKDHFLALEVYGKDKWGEILLTSYFEPVISGSLAKMPPFTAPVLRAPKNYVEVDLASFANARPDLSAAIQSRSMLRGHLLASSGNEVAKVVALSERAEIVEEELKSGSRPLAYVDPIDLFFMQIQGSGFVRFKNGNKMHLGFAGQNGYPYVALGKFLKDKIESDKMSQQTIEQYLRSLPSSGLETFLNQNPSYVFFKKLKLTGAMTSFGTEVVDGRTLATDFRFFPKGALAFLEFQKPIFENAESTEPSRFEPAKRFVLDQDTGGAIRGPARADLFWGKGPSAKQSAGWIRDKARLIYFLPKAEWVSELKARTPHS